MIIHSSITLQTAPFQFGCNSLLITPTLPCHIRCYTLLLVEILKHFSYIIGESYPGSLGGDGEVFSICLHTKGLITHKPDIHVS